MPELRAYLNSAEKEEISIARNKLLSAVRHVLQEDPLVYFSDNEEHLEAETIKQLQRIHSFSASQAVSNIIVLQEYHLCKGVYEVDQKADTLLNLIKEKLTPF